MFEVAADFFNKENNFPTVTEVLKKSFPTFEPDFLESL